MKQKISNSNNFFFNFQEIFSHYLILYVLFQHISRNGLVFITHYIWVHIWSYLHATFTKKYVTEIIREKRSRYMIFARMIFDRSLEEKRETRAKETNSQNKEAKRKQLLLSL